MARVGRVLLWTVVLVAPGGFLLFPVLAATSLGARNARTPRERFAALLGEAREALAALRGRWLRR